MLMVHQVIAKMLEDAVKRSFNGCTPLVEWV